MKVKMLFLLILSLVLLVSIPASAENVRENPSVYSFAEIVQKLPDLWTTGPLEIMDLMKDYPDFECWRSYDLIGCVSVNNKRSAEIHVNYQFSSDADDAEFIGAVFTKQINSSEDVQKIIESFWLPGMSIANIWGADYPDDQVTLYFSTENTLMNVSVPWPAEGGLWLVIVDLGVVRG